VPILLTRICASRFTVFLEKIVAPACARGQRLSRGDDPRDDDPRGTDPRAH
jgi:hypothetical protein